MGLRDMSAALVAVLTIGSVLGNPTPPLRNYLEGVNHYYGCPLLKSVGACDGLFRYVPATFYMKWQGVSDRAQSILWRNGGLECEAAGKLISKASATCVFSDRYCSKLTVSGTVFNMKSYNVYESAAGETVSFMPREVGSGRSVLDNGSADYVCEADEFRNGPQLGFSTLNGVNYYVVAQDQVSEGLYYRLFTVDVPAGVAGGIEVYPLVNGWGRLTTATKLMASSTDNGAEGARVWLGEAGDVSFRMHVSRMNCKKYIDNRGPFRVNVLQVRMGNFQDVLSNIQGIAAGNARAGKDTSTFRYYFFDSVANQQVFGSFTSAPILFTEPFYLRDGSHQHYQYTVAIGTVTGKDFTARLRGNGVPLEKRSAHFFWIGIFPGTQNSNKLFGVLSYRQMMKPDNLNVDPAKTDAVVKREQLVNYKGDTTLVENAIGFYQPLAALDAQVHATHYSPTSDTGSTEIDIMINLCGADGLGSIGPSGLPWGLNGIVFQDVFKDTRRPDMDARSRKCNDVRTSIEFKEDSKASEGATDSQCPLEDSYCSAVFVSEPGAHYGIYDRLTKTKFVHSLVVYNYPKAYWAQMRGTATKHELHLDTEKYKFVAKIGNNRLTGSQIQCLKNNKFIPDTPTMTTTATTTAAPPTITKVGDEMHYTVPEDEVIEGLYYRMFRVDIPAGLTGNIKVIPLVNSWGSKSTATKLVVHSDNGSAAGVIPWLSESGDTTFKMSLNHLGCVTAVPGPVRVNVLQVRLGRYHMNTTQSIAAGTNAAGMKAEFATYKYLFWTSGIGAVPYEFAGVPVVFTQISEWHGATPPHHEYTLQLGAVTKNNFQLLLRGRKSETIPGESVDFYWIGIYTGTGGVGSGLFGMLSYRTMLDSDVTLPDGAAPIAHGPMNIRGEPTSVADAMGFYEPLGCSTGCPQVALHYQSANGQPNNLDVLLRNCGTVATMPQKVNGIIFSEVFNPDIRKPAFETSIKCDNVRNSAEFKEYFSEEDDQCPLEDSYCSLIIVTEPSAHGMYSRKSKHVFVRDAMVVQTRDNWAEYSSTGGDKVLNLTTKGYKFSASLAGSSNELPGNHFQCLKNVKYLSHLACRLEYAYSTDPVVHQSSTTSTSTAILSTTTTKSTAKTFTAIL